MGGFVAATLALAHPERVTSLLLSDAVGVASPEPSEAELRIREGRNPFLLDDVAAFPEFYAMTMARPPFVPGFVRAAIAEDYVVATRPLRGDLHRLLRRRDPRRPARRDHRARPWSCGASRTGSSTPAPRGCGPTASPGARTVRYPDAGHMPMLELPRRSAADYRAFLARVGAGLGPRR